MSVTPPPLPLPWPLQLYGRAAALLTPLAPFFLERRARRGKEDRARMDERVGKASRARPAGRLVWVHGASVGETVSLLPVIEEFTRRGVGVLVTSGTVTSAEVMDKRLPAGAIHQYVPLDAPPFAQRFLDHWQPDCALFAESELWPNLIIAAQARDIPVMIVNGRMSERSFQRWRKTPAVIRALLARIDLCLAQTQEDAFRYGALGAAQVQAPGNLKYDGPAPPADPVRLGILSGRIAGRPVWLAASTHPGEEEQVLDAHAAAAARASDVLTMIVPRHPDRGAAIAALARSRGLTAGLRSTGDAPDHATQIYIADTIGELGIFYRLAPLVFMGGSLIAHGGQNPIEPAKLGVAILHGPHVFNFTEVFARLNGADGARAVADGAALAQSVTALLFDPAAQRAIGARAHDAVMSQTGATQRTIDAIAAALAQRAPPPQAEYP